jgi:hypothetical protein
MVLITVLRESWGLASILDLQVGGKGWPVVLGRRDSLTSHFAQANSTGPDGLPSPFVSLNLTFQNFAFHNFSHAETITLSGTLTSTKIRYLCLVAFTCVVEGRMVIRRLRSTEDPSKNREHHPRQK